MFGVKTVAHHAGLMERMAERVGADLGDAVAEHRLSASDYRTAVIRCTTCDASDECGHWMDCHAHAEGAPAYCRNRDLLERLSHAKA
jgi:hypothetical protein